MEKGSILVTGGAGYIGSHVVRQLGARGERVFVLDDLSTGFPQAVLAGELIRGDVADRTLVARILADNRIESVIHFAAKTVVPESVQNPLKYYAANTCKTRTLLETCQLAGVKHVVFSSTAAVYGDAADGVATEQTPLAPISPYGRSKLMSEWMLADLAAASALRYVALRYFNVAGADPEARIGQATRGATLLIKVAVEAALGKRSHLSIYGTDYPTPDGTGVRDFIHVEDLADAHLRALDYLRAGGASTALNCGYGHGFSVREVIETVRRVSGQDFEVREEPRRTGDIPALIASNGKIKQLLDWRPRHDDLEMIVRSALAWEKKIPGLGGWPS